MWTCSLKPSRAIKHGDCLAAAARSVVALDNSPELS